MNYKILAVVLVVGGLAAMQATADPRRSNLPRPVREAPRPSALEERVPEAPRPPASLTGHWNVVATPTTLDNCKVATNSSVYQWMIADNQGKLSVTVLGETGFPKLSGSYFRFRGKASMEGRSGTRHSAAGYASCLFDLQAEDRKLTGTRYFLGYRGEGVNIQPCMVAFSIEASRQ